MVREVAIQDPLKPRTHDRHRFVPALVELITVAAKRQIPLHLEDFAT